MDAQRKPILCLDFDGVCHSYTSGWQGADVISDDATPGLFEFLWEVAPHFEIYIFSSRSNQPGGIEAMRQWFMDHGHKWHLAGGRGDGVISLTFPIVKPPATIAIDDRSLTFDGTWPTLAALRSFQPWHKRNPGEVKTIGPTRVMAEVGEEHARQDERWGEQNHDDYIWLAILTEEVGEAAQAALHAEFGGKAAGTLRDELIQVAAVATAWIECIDRRTHRKE